MEKKNKRKEMLLDLLISKSSEEINDIIKSKGKSPKLISPFKEVKR